MRTASACLLAAAGLSVGFGYAATGDSGVPNLIGVWVGEYEAYFAAGQSIARLEVHITEQEAALFRGVIVWERPADQHPPLANSAEEKKAVVGVVDFDGKTLHIAEQGDGGRIDAQRVGPDRLRAIYVQSGANAVVFRLELTRQHSGGTSPQP